MLEREPPPPPSPVLSRANREALLDTWTAGTWGCRTRPVHPTQLRTDSAVLHNLIFKLIFIYAVSIWHCCCGSSGCMSGAKRTEATAVLSDFHIRLCCFAFSSLTGRSPRDKTWMNEKTLNMATRTREIAEENKVNVQTKVNDVQQTFYRTEGQISKAVLNTSAMLPRHEDAWRCTQWKDTLKKQDDLKDLGTEILQASSKESRWDSESAYSDLWSMHWCS